MFVIREARPKDGNAILRLARHLDSYNLPYNKRAIQELINVSQRSFHSHTGLHGEGKYLFVIEDISRKHLVGSSLIIARHGTKKLPHLAFRIKAETKRSRTLKKSITHHTLVLEASRRGFTELGGLVVLPRYRRRPEGLGKQLSYARFAYIKQFPWKFRNSLLVEFRPKIDLGRGNHLWRTLGERFTGLSYHEADHLSARNKEFILSLFPKEKIYCSLLTERAMRDLHVPEHEVGRALHMLKKNGFRFLNQVDPFDGGPHYGANQNQVRLIRKTFIRSLTSVKGASPGRGKSILVMKCRRGSVRALVTCGQVRGKHIQIPELDACRLGAKDNERISITPL